MNTSRKFLSWIRAAFVLLLIELLVTACAPKVDNLIQKLDSDDVYIRRNATEKLGDIGDPIAVDSLIKALDDGDYLVLINAITALGKIGDPRAVEPLVGAYLAHETDPTITEAILETLVSIGEPAVDELISMLSNYETYESHQRDEEKRLASYALKKMGKPAIDGLVEALENEELRSGAAHVLNDIGYTPPYENSLVWYWIGLKDEKELIKLGSIAVEPLMTQLESQDVEIKNFAIFTLGEIGDPTTIDLFISMINESDDYRERRSAAFALGNIGGLSAIEALIAAFDDAKPEVRDAVREALVQIGEPAIDSLSEAIYSNESRVAGNSFMALGEIGGQHVIELMENIIIFPDERMTYSIYAPVALVMANGGEPSALYQYLESKDTLWVYKSLIAIGKTGTEDVLIAALNKYGDEDMAIYYLNCGNGKLESAAKTWAENHGYSVVSLQGGGSSGKWGGD